MNEPPTAQWQTALTEADDLRRWLTSASAALERLMIELHAIQQEAGYQAREELARDLVAGLDGGVLALLASLASGESSGSDAPRIAALILERLCRVLDLTPVDKRGLRLRPTPHELASYEVFGSLESEGEVDEEQEYVVLREGWRLGPKVIAWPLVGSVEHQKDQSHGDS